MITRYLNLQTRFTFLAALLLCAFFALPGFSAETIKSYDTVVTLNLDSSVTVTETIEVVAEGRDIRRGIYRDIPTVLVDEGGKKVRSDLEILEVKRDGVAEPFHTESITNGRRIYVGDADVFLSNGVYRYTISFTMSRMARRFEAYDELFWNATGNFWAFPIETATATLRLPDGAIIENVDGYTGAFGSTLSNIAINTVSANEVVFRLTEPLAPYEGMSVAASFQKGVLNEVEGAEQVGNFLSDYREVWMPALAVLIVLAYYFSSWSSVGRDPKKGTIIPRFYAPKGFSPALVHYIWARGWKKSGWQAFTAAIVSLGVKGLVDIRETGRKTTLSVTPNGFEDEPPLPAGEAIVYNYLHAYEAVTINKITGPKFRTKRTEFTSAIQAENRQVYFLNNTKYVVFGVMLSILCVLVMLFTGVLAPEWFVVGVISGIGVSMIVFAVRSMFSSSGAVKYIQLGLFLIFGLNFTAGIIPALPISSNFSLPVAAIAAGSIIAMNVIFSIIMRAPTVQGRKVMDEIDGFRMYLETAEKNRLNFQDEPELTTSRFEKILPYAIALGVEKPWTEHFESELIRNAPADQTPNYQPSWYSKPNFSSSSFSKDMGKMATGMSASMIAAQPATSSSSGSSGGGSSGGGGGGGGGGGW